jgi:hypothetical protein
MSVFANQVVLSDAIVLWRVHVLWGRNRILLGISVLLLLFTTLSILVNFVSLIVSANTNGMPTSTGRETIGASLGTLSSLFTNVWAAGLVGVKVWIFRRDVTKVLRSDLSQSLERALLLVIESGLLYCIFWVSNHVAPPFIN